MDEPTKRITPAKCATVLAFLLFALGALFAFGYYTFDVAVSLIAKKDIIAFNKGAMYMLGVGLGAGLLVIFMIHELTGREISSSYNQKATRTALMSIGLIFIYPQIADYVVSSKLEGMDYIFCENQSYRWLHVQNKVYGINADACNHIAADTRTNFSNQ